LHAELADLASVGIDYLAMEASSHGLHQHRLDGVRLKVAAFTNLSRDHMDYHKDMGAYLAAKMRLFLDILAADGIAVLNADIPEFDAMAAVCAEAGRKVFSYGFKGRDFKILSTVSLPQGQKLDLEVLGQSYQILLPLVGGFQAMNALCALACVVAQDYENLKRTQILVAGLERLKGVPGRLQLVQGRADCAVYVDYAHTPDALETVLTGLRSHTKNRLICLFGCGGSRDQGKRPIMGAIAARIADVVIVTDDNPRIEDPAEIRAQVMNGIQEAGVRELHEVADRRKAIGFAMEQMASGDVLLVAGKGHEQGQIFNGYSEAFDDVNEVEIAMRRVKGNIL
jgi:UDP-N-acetylmuramyl-tripeptide synthetase